MGFCCLLAQSNPPEYNLVSFANETEMLIDGQLNEPIWDSICPIQQFHLHRSATSQEKDLPTSILLFSDDQYLYLGILCIAPTHKYQKKTNRPDGIPSVTDGVYWVIDPGNVREQSYFFGITPFGIKFDAMIVNQGTEVVLDRGWSPKWHSMVSAKDSFWVAEVKIPLSTFHFENESNQWGFNCFRTDLPAGKTLSWFETAMEENPYEFKNLGHLSWEDPMGDHQHQIAIQPAIVGRIPTQVNKTRFDINDPKLQLNLRAQWNIFPTTSADIVINPDFTSTEVDRQFLNLRQFEPYYVETKALV